MSDHGHHHHAHTHDHDHTHRGGLWRWVPHALTPHSHDAADRIVRIESGRIVAQTAPVAAMA